MMKMTGQRQQYTSQYPNLLMTTEYEPTKRFINETYSNSRRHHSKDNYHPSSFQPKNIYYNSNHRNQQQQYFTRPPRRPQQQQYYNSYDHIHQQHQPIRPLMEIKDNALSLHQDSNNTAVATAVDDDDKNSDISYQTYKQREPKQRGQYRNRKAELDWDHGFDLDLIDLYTTQIDVDSRSLTSTISSSDHSFSSI